MMQESIGQQLAREAVDGLLKQAGKRAQRDTPEEEVSIDPETQKKLIDRELKRVTDPEFALAEEATRSATERMRQERERNSGVRSGKEPEPEKKGNWLVVNGQMLKDMVDGYMTFNEALQVLAIQNPGAKLGWTVVGGKPFKTEEGEMTLLEAIQVAALERKEEGDPEIKALLKVLAQKDIDAKDAQLKAIVDQNKILVEHLTNPAKGGSTSGVKTKIFTLDSKSETGYKETVFEPGDTIILPPPPREGKSVEELKEENRHAEEKERIDNEKTYKTNIANTLASIPEKIGRGLAGSIVEAGNKGAINPVADTVARTAAQEDFKCPDCGNVFKIPEGAEKITCPYCPPVDGKQVVFLREKK